LRVSEVLEDVDRGREDRGTRARPRERQRYGAENPPGPRAEVVRRLLHARIASRERIGDELVCEWKERDRLNTPDPVEPIDARRLPEDSVADHPSSAEKEGVRGGDHERRREERKNSDETEERLPAHVRIDHRVRVDESKQDRGRRRKQRELDRVAERDHQRAFLKELDVAARSGSEDDLQLRIDDEQKHQRRDSQQREQECRLALRAAPLSTPLLRLMYAYRALPQHL